MRAPGSCGSTAPFSMPGMWCAALQVYALRDGPSPQLWEGTALASALDGVLGAAAREWLATKARHSNDCSAIPSHACDATIFDLVRPESMPATQVT